MTLLIKESEVDQIFTLKDAYESLREAFIYEENKRAINTKRIRTSFSGSTLTYQAGALEGYIGFKTYVRGNFVSLLFSSDGELLMIAESDRLSLFRTGALSVLAADVMRKSYSSVGIIGLGKQGIAQVEAFHNLVPGAKVLGYTRSPEREGKARKTLSKLGIPLQTLPSIKDVVSKVDVIVTITTATSPFLKREYVGESVHINAMGSNLPERVELFPEIIKASALIAVEDKDQAREEAGDLILAEKMGMLDWKKTVNISEILAGKVTTPSGITIFKSVGIGLEDVAVMKTLFNKAKSRGLGREIEVNGRWSPE